MKKKLLLAFSFMLIPSIACSLISNNIPSEPDPSIINTSVAATQMSQNVEITNTPEGILTPTETITVPTVEPDYLLPRSLYYRGESSPENFQVWRLERDGITNTQVTNEPIGVDGFAVNPIDGRVAFIVANQIFLIDADGSHRAMLIDGGPIDESSSNYHYLTKISGLAWSPDGDVLAYGRGGLNFHTFSTGISSLLIPNETIDYGGGNIGPQTLYFPDAWSEDGTRLMISEAWMEGGTLSVYQPSTGINTVLGYGITCCNYDWNPNGTSVLVGSHVLGLIESGLWRYNGNNGAETVLLPSEAPDGTYNFAGWPKKLANGDLVYFYNNIVDPNIGSPSLIMVHTAADGLSGLFQVRPESWEIYEALWDAPGENVVIIQPSLGPSSYPRRGPIGFVDTLGNPVVPLAPSGFDLQWGP